MTREQFNEEICLARDFMGSRLTTSAQWDALQKRLGQLSINMNLSENLRDLAWGQLMESSRRRMFVEVGL